MIVTRVEFSVCIFRTRCLSTGGTSDEQQQHLDKYFIMNESSLRFSVSLLA